MKNVKLFEQFISESVSSSEKKKFLDFFAKAEGKQVRVTIEEFGETITEEGKLEKSKYDMYKVDNGDMWIEPDYLITSDIKIKSISPKKIIYELDTKWTIEILK